MKEVHQLYIYTLYYTNRSINRVIQILNKVNQPRRKVCKMPRRPLLLDPFNPVRKLIRMSWSKENTWALDTKAKYDDQNSRRTVFQQRWIAKREVRGYHVPNITQKQFINRHFKTAIKLQHLSKKERDLVPTISALGMAQLEKRVDVIVFRSHFASSTLL